MRQLFLDKGALAIKEVSQPLLTNDTMLVAVHYSFVSSGTEASVIASSVGSSLFTNIGQKITSLTNSLHEYGLQGPKMLVRQRMKGFVQQLGYSCAGRVVAVGNNITRFRVGDLVACAGVGFANHADMICVPENLAVKVSHERSMQQASITTIGAIALQGIRRAQLQLGETVCIIGLGLLGQLSVQLARLAGCTIIGVDLLENRIELAKKSGAVAAYNGTDSNLKTTINFLTGHQGVDCTIIAAASKSDVLVQQAMEFTRRKGKVVLVGDVGLRVQRNPFYSKEIDFLISCSYGPGRYDATYEQHGVDYPYAYVRWTENRNMQAIVSLIEQNQLSITPLISHSVDITNALDGYKTLQEKEGLGILIGYLPNSERLPVSQPTPAVTATTLPKFIPAKKTTLRVGVIGVGGFVRTKLLPILAGINNVKIEAIVDPDAATALSVARLYDVTTILSDDVALFQNDQVDVILVASPHSYHADQIIQALCQGKAVFAEKPMVTSQEKLDQLKSLVSSQPQVPLCVDYNRSFAPFIRAIKEQLRTRSAPCMMHYRMNAGFIPKAHWMQTELGAGRLIGEACHIFELFCFLTDAEPVAISVETMQPNKESLLRTDNAAVQISFSDGSVCSLLYTAVGAAGAGKERLELFYDGKTIIMDDYRTLQGYGLPTSFNQSTHYPDKGHEYLVRQFFGALRADQASMPMSMEHLMRVAQLTLTAHELAIQGGGAQECKNSQHAN
jgi:predicted dehydrogenase/threonine dehydrogenase-like Zn-dependent dehydrogenase